MFPYIFLSTIVVANGVFVKLKQQPNPIVKNKTFIRYNTINLEKPVQIPRDENYSVKKNANKFHHAFLSLPIATALRSTQKDLVPASMVQRKDLHRLRGLHKGSHKLRYEDSCDSVCSDLPKHDNEPVCMMFSRYKKGFQFFVNECHARRAICKENLLLHMVHMSRCIKSYQYYMPVN